MTFNSVISSMRAGYSAYTPTLRGYLSRVDEVLDSDKAAVIATPFASLADDAAVVAWELARSGHAGTSEDPYVPGTTASAYGIPLDVVSGTRGTTGAVYSEPKGITAISHYVFVENSNIDPYGGTADTATEYAFTKYTYSDGTVAWFVPNRRSGDSVSQAAVRNVDAPLVLDAQLFPAFGSADWEVATTTEVAARKASLNAATRW